MTKTAITMSTSRPSALNPIAEEPYLLCWNCSSMLAPLSALSTIACPLCKAVTPFEDGIWRTLSPQHAASFERFITDYEFIRSAEGRGSPDAAYYRTLPLAPASHPLAAQWKIRARTFQYLTRHVLPHAPQKVLDLGAGNAWLSHRLALLGHHPVAVDLLTNAQDGLGAAAHYPVSFPRVQAALDHLPFPNASFGLAIFNASFHYAEDLRRTLAEALRCTCPGGLIVIADTPWYAQESSGLRMVEEKHRHFLATYGFSSNALHSQEFLTPDRLATLAKDLHLTWSIHKPSYGLAWSLRPLRASLKGQRPPSQFHVFVAEVPA